MRRAIRTAVGLIVDVFEPPGPVLELGSYYVPGRQALGDLRPFFPGREYVGTDIRPGPGVDRIEDAQALSFGDASMGVVVACEVLEHLPDPDRVIREAWRVLRPDGLLVLSVPFQYCLHGLPNDYWRFTASGVATLLEPFPGMVVFMLGPRLKPAFVFAVAAKAGGDEFRVCAARFRDRAERAYHASRWTGRFSVLQERARDFFGFLLGRAELGVTFHAGAAGEVSGERTDAVPGADAGSVTRP